MATGKAIRSLNLPESFFRSPELTAVLKEPGVMALTAYQYLAVMGMHTGGMIPGPPDMVATWMDDESGLLPAAMTEMELRALIDAGFAIQSGDTLQVKDFDKIHQCETDWAAQKRRQKARRAAEAAREAEE